MFRLIEENLVRQNKGMMLLEALLKEEFTRLMNNKPQKVSQIELSVQELLRQLSTERVSLRAKVGEKLPGALRVSELYQLMNDEERSNMAQLLEMLDSTEQKCAIQAAKNNEMVMALFDQSKQLLDFMHGQIKPKNTSAYAASGRFAKAHSQPSLLKGRL